MKVSVTLKHNDKEYSFITEGCKYDTFAAAQFMWNKGNFSCDCNKSLFIQRYCDESFPDMECGDDVKLVNIEVVEE